MKNTIKRPTIRNKILRPINRPLTPRIFFHMISDGSVTFYITRTVSLYVASNSISLSSSIFVKVDRFLFLPDIGDLTELSVEKRSYLR